MGEVEGVGAVPEGVGAVPEARVAAVGRAVDQVRVICIMLTRNTASKGSVR